MKAGIDFGNSLVKAYWQKDGIGIMQSSAGRGVPALAELLIEAGISEINAIGIGPRDGFEVFPIREPDGDPLAAEVAGQANGLRRLHSGAGLPDRFLLVSIGTGTSYTDVDGENVMPANHIGNPMGGGFIDGLGRIFMMGGPARIGELAAAGTPPDTLMKDRLPALVGNPIGDFVISHFNKASVEMEEADFAAGLIHCVAVSVVRDLMAKECPDVVFIGSTLGSYPSLRSYLQRYLGMLGKTAHFPVRGEYSGAVGAFHRDD